MLSASKQNKFKIGRLNKRRPNWFRDELLIYGFIRESIDRMDIEWIDFICHQYFNDHENTTLSLFGYKSGSFIRDTLQGKLIYAASNNPQDGQYIVKMVNKELHNKGITISKDGKTYKIKQNVIKESELLKKLLNNNPPASLVAFVDFFEDKENYYLIIQNGGTDFFDFVTKCHQLINNGKLSLKEWRKHCKFMFAQMIQFIKWLHNEQHYCFIDTSLESLLISNDAYFDEETGKLNKCYIKFMDFGVATEFDVESNPTFLCDSFEGKMHYKSPKKYARQRYMADKEDIWGLGVCLFMMIIGAPPYNKADDNDFGYQRIRDKQMSRLLHAWGRIGYVTPNSYNLLERMLCVDESKRITINEIISHPWINIYFPEKN